MNVYGLRITVMQFLHWFSFLIIYLFALLIASIVMPVIPFFVSKEGYLPKWLGWFQTPDNPVDGDDNWNKENKKTHLPKWAATYLVRLKWLYRNPIYGFSINVLGAKKDPKVKPTLNIVSNDEIRGTYKGYFTVYWIRRNAVENKKFKVYIGWKLKSENFERYQFAFLLNPFQKNN